MFQIGQFNRKRKQIKMERRQEFDTQSICSELNLRIQDLQVSDLMSNVIYRRLYNIVVNDRNKTDYQYRKNLIRQLYFLLKITPIMKPELQQSYLEKLELWYNKNDHKKTQLGSGRLRNIVDGYVTNKNNNDTQAQQDLLQRPQSGVTWNKNVAPFLRPYTAQRQPKTPSRPQSYKSKYGGRSTTASTQMQQQSELHIKDFALSIRQQLQMSEDFIAKNRTIHPHEDPIYEQLFNIIRKVGVSGSRFRKNQAQDDDNEILFQRDKEQFLNQQQHPSTQSSATKINRIDQRQDEVQILQVQDFGKVSQQSQKQQDQDQQQEKLQQKNQQQQESPFSKEKKVYLNDRDQRILQNKNIKPVEGFLHLTQEDQYDTMLLKKLNNKYTHITDNKFVNYSKDDHEMVRNYLNYSRVKSAMKKQMSRKSQSSRLLSAKANKSSTNLTGGVAKNPRIYSAIPRKNLDNDQSQVLNFSFNGKNAKGPKVFDLTRPQSAKTLTTAQKSLTHYNQRQELDKIYRTPIQDYKKFNKKNLLVSQIKCKDKNLLTKYDAFLSRQKINPIADIHIQGHNKEALEEIQKIKQKVAGLSKKCVSTDSLMKALYIDSYDDIGSCSVKDDFVIHSTINSVRDQKSDDPFDWRNRNIYFNLISNGQKKLKKKKRLLKKKQK